MENNKKTGKLIRNVVIVAAVLAAASFAVWRTMPHAPAFCYNFAHDMQFGDRKVAHPVNQGSLGPGGIMYYLPEVPMLQTALSRQGFYVDKYESTGGGVYAGAFFGPSTKTAVMSFQKKFGLPQTGEVNNDTIDKLSALYRCPTSTAAIATSTLSGYTATTSKIVK